MKRKTYRSLDNPSSFFGIQGSYIAWMGGICAISLFVALIVGVATFSILGFVTFGVGAVGGYFYVMSLQGKESAREYSKKLGAKRYVRYVHFPSTPLRHLWRKDRSVFKS